MKAGNVQILDQFGRPFSSRPIYKSGSYDDGLQRLPNYLKEPEQLSGNLTPVSYTHLTLPTKRRV